MNRPNSAVFRESDYHTPPPLRVSRSKRILERKSTACMCACFWVVLVVLVMFCVTVGLRVTGSRDVYDYDQILGDTTLVQFDPLYCNGIKLISFDAPASLYLLSERPPLTGWSNISLEGSFVIKDYKDYVDDYGWYDYGEYAINVDYITWSFSLNKGSLIDLSVCLDDVQSSEAGARFILLRGSNTYNNWRNDLKVNEEYSYYLQSCSGAFIDKIPTIKVSSDDEYYFIFLSSSDSNDPHVNLTISLRRTEYVVSSNISKSLMCTTGSDNTEDSCTVSVPYRGKQKYSVIQTTNQETNKVKYGSTVALKWKCLSRSWVYASMFACPVIFFTTLFISMYCIIVYFWNRKLTSYNRLNNANNSNETNTQFKIVYGDQEKSSINNKKTTVNKY